MLGKILQTKLENGCRIVTAQMERVESVALCFDAGVGSRNEKCAEGGYSHFLEHLLFKGSQKYPSTRAISQPVEACGGNMNAYTANECTRFYARAPFDALRTASGILGDMFTRPRLLEKDIETERKVILEEISMYHDDDASFVSELSQAALWPGHALGRPILGTPETLSGANHARLAAYHESHYTAGGTIIAAAGKVEHDLFVDLVRPFAERLKPGKVPGFVKAGPKLRPVVPLLYEKRETQQVQAVIGFRVPSFDTKKKAVLTFLSQILGRGMTSRLFMTVREKYGLAYSVSAGFSNSIEAGQFQVSAGLNPEKALAAIELCGKELRRIAKESVTKAEFKRAKLALVGGLRLAGETSSAQMFYIADQLRFKNCIMMPEEAVELYNAVTAEEILDAAAEMFLPELASIALVMPQEHAVAPERYLEALRAKL